MELWSFGSALQQVQRCTECVEGVEWQFGGMRPDINQRPQRAPMHTNVKLSAELR